MAASGLLVNERPIAGTALGILLSFVRVVDGEFELVKGPEILIRQDLHGVPVRSHGQLERLLPQIGEDRCEIRMKAVLTGSEIDRAQRHALDDPPYLLKIKPIGARRIAIAEGAREIALIGEPQP